MLSRETTLLAAAAMMLGAGAAAEETVAPAEPVAQPAAVVSAALPPVPPVLHMAPVAGMPAFYWLASPGMVWPAPPLYPAPMMMPPAAVWRPFVLMLVPVLPAAPAAEVSYGPVADTPVVQLPPSAADPARPADTPADHSPAQLAATPALPDYGPVTPTPVVDLLALQQPAAVRPRARHQRAAKPLRQPTAAASPAVADKPARKRMCWSNGVVAPCR